MSLLLHRVFPNIRERVTLAPFTTFKIGGPAEFFLEAKTADEAARAVEAAREDEIPLTVLGGGSNMLVADRGVRGLVLRMADRGFTIDGDRVTADAGVPSGLLAMKTAAAGLSGFEWAIGLPGTIGGAVRGNAGMFGGEMKDCVDSVRVFRDTGQAELSVTDCGFAYRDSDFKRTPGGVVLSSVLRLRRAEDPAILRATLLRLLLEKKKKQPVEYPSAGCLFTNWRPSGPEQIEALRRAFFLGADDAVPITGQGCIPAGWLIDRAGLKGCAVGAVAVSDKHANFTVARKGATSADVLALVRTVRERVVQATGGLVTLHEEVAMVGFDDGLPSIASAKEG